jgi:hypothetical protein
VGAHPRFEPRFGCILSQSGARIHNKVLICAIGFYGKMVDNRKYIKKKGRDASIGWGSGRGVSRSTTIDSPNCRFNDIIPRSLVTGKLGLSSLVHLSVTKVQNGVVFYKDFLSAKGCQLLGQPFYFRRRSK